MGSAGLSPGSRTIADDLLSPQQLLHLVASSASSGQDSGQLIIDLRSRSRYHHRHIPGSHSIPSGRLISGEPPDGDLILVGETTLHSAATLEQLHAQGYARRIRHLAGGFEAWRQLELPVASQRKRSAPFRHGERFRTAVSGLLFGPWGRSRSRAGA